MRPRLVFAGAALVALGVLVASMPFWLPRYVDVGGSNAVATAWFLGAILGTLAGSALVVVGLARGGVVVKDATYYAAIALGVAALALGVPVLVAMAALASAGLGH